jgi:DNA-binding NarL/FixJ family response regulator
MRLKMLSIKRQESKYFNWLAYSTGGTLKRVLSNYTHFLYGFVEKFDQLSYTVNTYLFFRLFRGFMTNQIKTLIVDDHDVVRAGLASTLEGFENINVIGMAASESEAIELFDNTEEVDLLIIDIALEDVNTFNIVRNIKKKFKKLKVVFISGFSENEYHQRMHEAGGDGFWCKLDKLDNLLATLKSVAIDGSKVANGINSEGSNGKPILSNREEQVISCIARGMTVKEIADKFSLSNKTVEAHKSNLMMKLSVHSQVELVRWAIKNGIVTP